MWWHRLMEPLWRHRLMEPLWRHGLREPLWHHGLILRVTQTEEHLKSLMDDTGTMFLTKA